LAVEEGKSSYMADLPRVFEYVVKVTAKYKALHSFNVWLTDQALVMLEKQSWSLR